MADTLDDTNWAILQMLQENARLSYAELGKRVGLTAPAAAERVRKLEEAGIITGYHADLDLRAIGLPIRVFIQLGQVHERFRDVIALVDDMPEVLACYRITGEDCFIIEAAVTSTEHLLVLLEQLTKYGQTKTSIVLAVPVQRRDIVRPADGADHKLNGAEVAALPMLPLSTGNGHTST
jgi:Lrp/AsnC family transcriptional regulator, leucine-responsive regulatory protein